MSHDTHPSRAFVLGAGLGMRLRPLTEHLPKPLAPIGGAPMVLHVLKHLADAGIRQVMINTHHAAERWAEAFPMNEAEGIRLAFRHEPILLDTGGGLKNVEDFFVGYGTFLIYNGDVLTSLPLREAIAHHRHERNLVTMILRGHGGPLHVSIDSDNQVVDIGAKSTRPEARICLFTGIHVVEPEIFQHIPDRGPQPIIPIYRDLIHRGLRIGGVVLDDGEWSDVGTLAEYERLNRESK